MTLGGDTMRRDCMITAALYCVHETYVFACNLGVLVLHKDALIIALENCLEPKK